MFAMAIVPLIGVVGLAVDSANGYVLKNRMTRSLDIAAIAAARAVDEGDPEATARKYFSSNFNESATGYEITDLTATLNADRTRVTVSARGQTPTYFMKIFGKPTMVVEVSASVERQMSSLEMALILDNTGSMSLNNRFPDMISATHTLIDLIFDGETVLDNTYLSLVPYTSTVNVGNSHVNWLRPNDRVNVSPVDFNPYGRWWRWYGYRPTSSDWGGCVEARPMPLDQGDAPPSVERFTSYFARYHRSYNPWPRVINTPFNVRWTTGSNKGPNVNCPTPITPLTNSRATIEEAVDDMAYWWASGGTLGNIALSWGWRTISPRWQGLWGGTTPGGRPEAYSDTKKVAVILTDGSNSAILGGYTSYMDWGDLGVSNRYASTPVLNRRMLNTCAQMKAQGIRIFSIIFQSSPGAAVRNTYESCATSADDYFLAPSGAQLQQAFRQIAEEVNSLRLVE